MDTEVTKTLTKTKVEKIGTNLKFYRSDKNGELVSYCAYDAKNGRWAGVRKDSTVSKKVCLLDKNIKQSILEGVLYHCLLIPMKNKTGFIVVSADVLQFRARIETTYIRCCTYMVTCKFGNKTIKFDPYEGRINKISDLQSCLKELEKRVDVENLPQVLSDFEKAGNRILTLMDADNAKLKGVWCRNLR